jgi:hypothetical protein
MFSSRAPKTHPATLDCFAALAMTGFRRSPPVTTGVARSEVIQVQAQVLSNLDCFASRAITGMTGKKIAKNLSFYRSLRQHMTQITQRTKTFLPQPPKKRVSSLIPQCFPMTIFSPTSCTIPLARCKIFRP